MKWNEIILNIHVYIHVYIILPRKLYSDKNLLYVDLFKMKYKKKLVNILQGKLYITETLIHYLVGSNTTLSHQIVTQ